jgi:hypothetical protein
MSNPTSNFGWQMPTATDLVTDLPADFEVFGQAVDTSLADLKGGTTGQVLKKNTNADMDFVWAADAAGMTNPMTTTGDIIYSSSGSTPARLGIGTTGQVLNVAAGIPAWTTPSGSLDNYALLNAGGTALTGASTITVSGISNINSMIIYVDAASCTQATGDFAIRFNSDSGGNYTYIGPYKDNSSAVDWNSGNGATSFQIGAHFTTASLSLTAVMKVDGAGGTGFKWLQNSSYNGGTTGRRTSYSGFYKGTSAITSVSILQLSGGDNFDAGTIYIYGA